MSEPVKKRAYEAGRRHAASAATRQRIVDAARELILLRGYRATTISAVAERADVNVDTVYELIGRKPVLLRELIEQAISGQDHGVVAEERAFIVAIREEPDPAVKVAMYARVICDTRGWRRCSSPCAAQRRPNPKRWRYGGRSAIGERPTCASSCKRSTPSVTSDTTSRSTTRRTRSGPRTAPSSPRCSTANEQCLFPARSCRESGRCVRKSFSAVTKR